MFLGPTVNRRRSRAVRTSGCCSSPAAPKDGKAKWEVSAGENRHRSTEQSSLPCSRQPQWGDGV